MKRVASAGVSYVMNDMLKDVFDYGTAAKARSLGFHRKFAGKTGTTSNYRDAWFIGYSPRVLSLVWIGFDDARSVRLAGGDACVPIWTQHMNRIAGLMPDVDWRRPDEVIYRQIDEESGMLATPYCSNVRDEIFVASTEPSSLCPLHAGSGEPSPFWQDENPVASDDEQRKSDDPARQQEQKKKADEKEKGIRRILRMIFGNGQ